MGSFDRWMKYGKAKLDDMVASGNATLDEKEAALAAEAEDKPWLRADGEAPTLDDVRARIQHDSGTEQPGEAAQPPDGSKLAEQQRKADERLAAIRDELGLGDSHDGPASGSDQEPH